ncbi:tubulin polymerization-promoting protein family member 3-like [Bombina bombina]|uniref:tubulin polymerization-promoting protein family member 3-like n=1 Tax=Bombina bombina TaxID=8345 RepID=UPI00235A7EFC|nr:tubulin polymerization-promoting protein family member 3-like [Bombina bombina]
MSSELLTSFRKFAIYGNPGASGNDMNGKNFTKLCKECKILQGKCTNADVDIVFSKVKSKGARVINFSEFQEALKLLSAKTFPGMPADQTQAAVVALVVGKEPLSIGTTKTTTMGAVDRLTDTSKYTGTHKPRFDSSGKGKGKSGREDVVENTGYVGSYKGKDTYNKKNE